MKRYLLPSALILVLGLGAAIAANNINKSVQLSQDPSGPIGFDTLNGVYFPAHVNVSGSPANIITGGTSPSISGDDYAGFVKEGTGSVTSGQITFRTAYVSTPMCAATSQSEATPLGLIATPGGINFTHVASVVRMEWNFICVGRKGG